MMPINRPDPRPCSGEIGIGQRPGPERAGPPVLARRRAFSSARLEPEGEIQD